MGQCGANIVKDISDSTKLPEWQIIYFDRGAIDLAEIHNSDYSNINIFVDLGAIYLLNISQMYWPYAVN